MRGCIRLSQLVLKDDNKKEWDTFQSYFLETVTGPIHLKKKYVTELSEVFGPSKMRELIEAIVCIKDVKIKFLCP